MGTVFLVGAGPGDPDLLTLRAHRLLQRADAVVYDALVNSEILELAPTRAGRFDVGRRKGEKRIAQGDVNDLLIHLSGSHEVVVRLKGGDPFVFGRGGEEALALRAAGVPFEVVPGVSAGIGALAYAGIPLTHRGVASSATFLTGHRVLPATGDREGVSAVGSEDRTLVIFMGLSRLEEIASELIRGGRSPKTPAAIVEWGTYREQRTVTGDLRTLPERVRTAGISGPSLIVVGEVVRLRSEVRWYSEGAEQADSPERSSDPPGRKEPGQGSRPAEGDWTVVPTPGSAFGD